MSPAEIFTYTLGHAMGRQGVKPVNKQLGQPVILPLPNKGWQIYLTKAAAFM